MSYIKQSLNFIFGLLTFLNIDKHNFVIDLTKNELIFNLRIFHKSCLPNTKKTHQWLTCLYQGWLIVCSISSQFKTKDYEIGILWFSANHSTLTSKSKDWLVCSQKEGSKWSNMSTCELLYQIPSTVKVQQSVLV